MKKLTIIAIIACAAMFASCKSQASEEVVEPAEEVVVEEATEEATEEVATEEAAAESTETVAE